MNARDPDTATDEWQARLALEFELRDGATIPTRRTSHGPLRTLKGLLPEGPGVWHQIVVHPPGGIAGGDTLSIDVRAGNGAQVLLTTPGAAKWHRVDRGVARQSLQLHVGDDACIEWLPLESIFFSGTQARIDNRVVMAPRATLLCAELYCLGRPAAGERFDTGSLGWRQCIEFMPEDGAPTGQSAFFEQASLGGDDPLLDSPAGLSGLPLFGMIIAAAPRWREDADAAQRLLQTARALSLPGQFAVTMLPGVLIGRWRGARADAGWQALRAVWSAWRPLINGRQALAPRIWST